MIGIAVVIIILVVVVLVFVGPSAPSYTTTISGGSTTAGSSTSTISSQLPLGPTPNVTQFDIQTLGIPSGGPLVNHTYTSQAVGAFVDSFVASTGDSFITNITAAWIANYAVPNPYGAHWTLNETIFQTTSPKAVYNGFAGQLSNAESGTVSNVTYSSTTAPASGGTLITVIGYKNYEVAQLKLLIQGTTTAPTGGEIAFVMNRDMP